MVAVVQTSIALGSMLGGVLFDSTGHSGTFLVSAAVLAVAAALAAGASRARGRGE